ncbi:Protein FAR1-RELATED SEQUENCE 12 [Linum grandiflorum]
MDLDMTVGAIGSLEDKPDVSEANPTVQMVPYVGMEFESEDDARNFYVEYARRVGFFVRVMQRRRSGVDGRTLARRLGCNKQGFSPNIKGRLGQVDKCGKWIVTRFEKEHNHPLVVSANGFIATVSILILHLHFISMVNEDTSNV